MSNEVRQAADRRGDGYPQIQAPQAKPMARPIQEGPVAFAETSTSYAAMLKEVYDGDAAEALAVANVGRRTGEPRDPQERASTAGAAASNRVAQPGRRTGAEEGSADPLAELRRRQKAGAVAVQQHFDADARNQLPVKAAHDQLMLAASQMSASEAATHVSFRSFLHLAKILSQRNWMRKIGCEEDLMRAQMAFAKRLAV